MKRVVIINWKTRPENPFEVFSNVKIVCESYPAYNYNTLNNYLSRTKKPYENDEVRIERRTVRTQPVKTRQIAMIGKRVQFRHHDEELQNLDFWLSRPIEERLDAVTRLRAQMLKRNERMNRSYGSKRRLK